MLGITTSLRVGNLMKIEENQKLSYRNAIWMFSLAGLLACIAIPSWNKQRHDDRIVSAKRHAEVLGYQVFEIYREAARNIRPEVTNSRAPASVAPADAEALKFRDAGSIGNDPWGQPYRYKLLGASQQVATGSESVKVQIWSAGPNKVFETEDQPGLAAENYIGDDVGMVLSMNSRPME